jgi:hypothetical protein
MLFEADHFVDSAFPRAGDRSAFIVHCDSGLARLGCIGLPLEREGESDVIRPLARCACAGDNGVIGTGSTYRGGIVACADARRRARNSSDPDSRISTIDASFMPRSARPPLGDVRGLSLGPARAGEAIGWASRILPIPALP